MTAMLMASDLITDEFTYVGFAPNRSTELNLWIRRLALAGQTVVFFEAPHRIAVTLQRILHEAGDIQLCVGRELTKVHEQFLRGSVSEVLAALGEPRGEFTVIAAFPPPSSLSASNPPTAAELRTEIGRITESSGLRGRAAMAEAGRKFGLATNAVYDLLRGADDSGD
jgi:16S rRNA (cytidine1402-2'-O)-methyltransferase